LIPLFLALSFWLGYLGAEALRLPRWRQKVGLRITVTGSRGKTSLVRMLASVLREDGRRVMAKTTGSQARIILPDAREIPVRRRGVPSILEQMGLLRFAAREKAQVLVAEVMSVHRENHLVESRRILCPHLVLMTNFRVDHPEAAGWTREEVAGLLLADVAPGSTVLVPETEVEPGFAEAVSLLGGQLKPVSSASGEKDGSSAPPFLRDNLGLVRAAALELGVSPASVDRGLREVRGDQGAHWVRSYRGREGAMAVTVNAFAANDPQSTEMILDWALGQATSEGGSTETVGLLTLRPDRGDRTAQWLEAFDHGFGGRFRRLYVLGFHAPAFRRALRRRGKGEGVFVLFDRSPERAMERVLAETGSSRPLVFGFGNFGGMGEAFVRHWLDQEPGNGGIHGA
jgi:poly-gamma-glutamate synthase PgsB/CapB